jgi:hypothetical protein
MKKYVGFVIVAILVFTGCAKHYYRVDKDSVDIYLKIPEAERVSFLSSLDGYKLHKAKQVDHKTWQVNVPGNTAFKYFYNVDGNVYVPPCALKENDDFGAQNCIYVPGM